MGEFVTKWRSKVMNPVGLLLIAAGLFTITGAYFDWEWYMNSRKARFMVTILSRNGARIFYGILGLVVVIIGALGWINGNY